MTHLLRQVRFAVVLLCAAVCSQPAGAADPSESQYPPSPVITAIEWAPKDEIIRMAPGSDNWPTTWGDDGHLYTGYGDGWGFKPLVEKKLSLGLCRVEGNPPDIRGFNIRSETGEQIGDGRHAKKCSGLLMVDGVLYMFVRNADNSQLAWSDDYARTWTWSDWRFTTSFGCPTFLNFGKNYAGARDDYVYVYSQDSDSAYDAVDRMVMARVPKARIRDRSAYEFFTKLDDEGRPVWTKEIDERGAVFEHAGHCNRSGISYNAALGRYIWWHAHRESDHPRGNRFGGGFAVYDAPEPWGSWTTVFFTKNWDVGPGESGNFPTKWMSEDGRTMWLVFSGNDDFAVREARLTISR